VQVSAVSGEGLDELREQLAAFARSQLVRLEATVPYTEGRLLSEIHAAAREVTQEAREDGTRVRALMPARDAARIRAALADAAGAR
jgi:GTP-binding protein HflX